MDLRACVSTVCDVWTGHMSQEQEPQPENTLHYYSNVLEANFCRHWWNCRVLIYGCEYLSDVAIGESGPWWDIVYFESHDCQRIKNWFVELLHGGRMGSGLGTI